MLYKYEYIIDHPIHGLNIHLDYFFEKIKGVPKNASFALSRYFKPDFVKILKNSPVLKAKFKSFFDAFKSLELSQKEEFYKKVVKCQSIESFFENTTLDCKQIHSSSIRQLINDNTLSDLTTYLFSTTLRSWGIEDHYSKIYEKMPAHKACPFCGVGEMHQSFREDYDHLAPKKHYPLLAINIRNLAPMCHACNTKFKGDADIFYKNNARRPFAYPYSTILDINFDYSKSIIPETDLNNEKGIWEIDFTPKNPLNQSWIEIFQIKKRYLEDYLQPKFNLWIEEFIDELIKSNINISKKEQLKKELSSASKWYAERRFQHTNIIKAPLFDFLSKSNNDIFYNSVLRLLNKKLQRTNAA